MSIEVVPEDWICLDSWWSAYTRTRGADSNSASAPVLDAGRWSDYWGKLDPWWDGFVASASRLHDSRSARELVTARSTESWEVLDAWWEVYAETGHATAEKIAKMFDRTTQEWRESGSRFDMDPLAADLSMGRFQRGPLQPSNEVGWSRWLSRLLAPSPALVSELFDVAVDTVPAEVIREDQLSKAGGSFRRPDVLLCYEHYGVSIEVKLGDENYGKTAETAELIERHYDDREWTHVLLLPERKRQRLESIVDPPVTRVSHGRLNVEWDEPGPVGVVFWRDVTRATRSLLRRDGAVDDHWAANAYLFCAVAEQRIMDFQPQPVIEGMAEPANVVDTIQPIALAGTLEEQLTYFREMVDS